MEPPVKAFARAFKNRTVVYYPALEGGLAKVVVWHVRPGASLQPHEFANVFPPKHTFRPSSDFRGFHGNEKATIKLPWYIVVQRVFDWVKRGIKHEPRMKWRW